jgi:hypothetical protein
MTTTPMKTLMSKKAFRLAKKTRKMLRKLRKQAIKSDDTTTLAVAEKMIETVDRRLSDNKKKRDEMTAAETKK